MPEGRRALPEPARGIRVPVQMPQELFRYIW
jgi:hypothetical protein